MHPQPRVDINLFVHNGAATVAAAIDSVLAQSWTNWSLTLIDDGSTDGTGVILAEYAARFSRVKLKRNRCNAGAIGAFQRGLWLGDADYVMPKSADDLIAPDFLSTLMDVLLTHPGCAMAHAGGLSFDGDGQVNFEYPASHNLRATGPDPVVRAGAVMTQYTSSPSFWGVYRRDAVDRLAPIAHRAGWDHVLLAELALYGEIRHVPALMYWRRGTGRPVLQLARAATREAERGLALEALGADAMWRMPCLTTAYAHLENFAVARLPRPQRQRLMADAVWIFGRRWVSQMRREAAVMQRHVTMAAASLRDQPAEAMPAAFLRLVEMLAAVAVMLPEVDLSATRLALAACLGAPVACPA